MCKFLYFFFIENFSYVLNLALSYIRSVYTVKSEIFDFRDSNNHMMHGFNCIKTLLNQNTYVKSLKVKVICFLIELCD